MMIIYWAFTFCILMLGARTFALLFVEASELEILKDTELFLHISVSFFPVLGLLCILRYTIQGAGYTNLAMLSGVSEMIARVLVSLYAVPAFGYLAVCFGDPTAWIAAVLFLLPVPVLFAGSIHRLLPVLLLSPDRGGTIISLISISVDNSLISFSFIQKGEGELHLPRLFISDASYEPTSAASAFFTGNCHIFAYFSFGYYGLFPSSRAGGDK